MERPGFPSPPPVLLIPSLNCQRQDPKWAQDAKSEIWTQQFQVPSLCAQGRSGAGEFPLIWANHRLGGGVRGGRRGRTEPAQKLREEPWKHRG